MCVCVDLGTSNENPRVIIASSPSPPKRERERERRLPPELVSETIVPKPKQGEFIVAGVFVGTY